ncbi:MAG: lipoprotein [Candidatus Aenigmarchaeota archaeon]|nr:lipoprotein [Candidatus Aenigmarchaeota archaeon]
MKKPLIFLLGLVVLVSGCTGQDTTTLYENDIVIIRDLQAVPGVISPEQTVRIIANIQNKGNKPITASVDLFDHCEGLFPAKDIKPNCGGGQGTLGSTLCPNIELGAQETKQVDWVLKSKKIELKTVCPQDGMKVAVRYKTKTISLTTISFITRAELERLIQSGGLKEIGSYRALGEGPVKPDVTVEDQQPISIDAGITVIAFQVENHGSGFLAVKDAAQQDAKPQVRLTKFDFGGLTPAGRPGDSCDVLQAANPTGQPISLIQKESSKYLCTISVPTTVQTQETKTITTEIEYDYEFRKSVKVTVEPKI